MMSLKIQSFDKEYELRFRIVQYTHIKGEDVLGEDYEIEVQNSNRMDEWHPVGGKEFGSWLSSGKVEFKTKRHHKTVDKAKEHIQELIEAIKKDRTYFISKVVVE